MSAVRLLPPKAFFSTDAWKAVTRVSPWRGLWLVAHAWLVSFAVIALATWAAHPLAWLLAVILVGGRQLGLAILMHDAAHGLLHPKRVTNNFLGQWLTGAAVGTDLIAYRTYHLQHHKFTQQAEDPDLSLSSPFPTSRASLARKVMRDLTAQTFFKQRAAQFAFAFKGVGAMFRGDAVRTAKADTRAGTTFNPQKGDGITAPNSDMASAIVVALSVGRFLLVQALLLTLSLALYGWTPFLIWLVALATSFPLYLRIRNIAEHACTATGSDDPFTHARTTRAGWIARATVAPYWVNYHSEHHLFMGVPCYRLAEVHAMLGRSGAHKKMTIAPNYWEVMTLASSRR